jgi:hemerythrin-like domain-containing protein
MESSTRNLVEDHVRIIKLAETMERITYNPVPEVLDLELVVCLIRNFADRFHHAKEEKLFFPLLEEKGFSPLQGPVAVMLAEHKQGRNYVKEISDNIEVYKSGDTAVLNSIFLTMLAYTSLIKNHILKEDNVLFKMADKVISPEEHKALLRKYEEIVSDDGEKADISYYFSEIDRLGKKYQDPAGMSQ